MLKNIGSLVAALRSLKSTSGAALAGSVRADNLSGFRGEGFTGQKDHATTSNDKGEWSITGIEASPDSVAR